jgi:hypothetical protein
MIRQHTRDGIRNRMSPREAATRGGAVQAVIAWSWDGMEYGPVAATRPQEELVRGTTGPHEVHEEENPGIGVRRWRRPSSRHDTRSE